MLWRSRARAVAQRLHIDPRYLRRFRWIRKARTVHSVGAPLRTNLGFVLADPEVDNCTYELANEPEVAEWVATVVGCQAEDVEHLLYEAHTDRLLQQRLYDATAARWWWTKRSPPFGKRLAWYAFARLLKPALIIETGVHDGLGSLLLLRALELNDSESAPGRLVSFDVNPRAGWIVGEHPLWELRVESSRDGLPAVLERGQPVGIFIHDSLHTYAHERFELETAAAHLAPGGLLISDNAHGTRALLDVCLDFGLHYHECNMPSRGHFYPAEVTGAGRP